VHVIAAFPADGCGVGPDPDCSAVPTNATLTFRFDRFLNPGTVNRQAIHVYTGDPDTSPGYPFEVAYDPVERVVEYRMPSGYAFAPHTLYRMELLVPDKAEAFGIRAFDGAPLGETDDLPLQSSFFTADDPVELVPDPSVSCADVVGQVFSDKLADCARGQCHRSFGNKLGDMDLLDAPYGLWLDSRANLAVSAIGRIAHETELGDASGGIPTAKGARFGVRMALIDPSNPGGSYLLYKLLRNPKNFGPCTVTGKNPPSPFCNDDLVGVSTHQFLPLADGQSIEPSADEQDRLREWFVRGEPMPLIGEGLGLAGLRAVSQFIAAGADCGR
jgi:hypothetical protein